MLLKSLEIQGFKSFPDKTRLEFQDGVTAVVGPNGSGKSNISDAVRWVLGEKSSKNLRGSKMEDVIFAGTQNRKPQGFAQVSLEFDNHTRVLDWDGDQVIVTRKYYRNSESEYRINGKPVQLKQITELFMDTGLGKDGYSIIGQGRIDEIVSAKSTDRREIFEEAAGITKFRYRKQESQRKLEQAEENLVRLRDILGELESRVAPLKIQAEKARQFLALAEQKKNLELSLWVGQMGQYRHQMKEQDDRLTLVQQSYEETTGKLEQIEEKISLLYESIQQSQVKMEELRAAKEENDRLSSERTAKIAVLQNDIHHVQEDIARLQKEWETLQSASGQLEQELEKQNLSIASLEQNLEQLDQQLQRKEQELLTLSEQRTSVSGTYEKYNQQLNRLTLERSKLNLNRISTEANIKNAKAQIDALDAQIRQRELDRESSAEELKEVNSLLQELEERHNSLLNTKSGYEMKLSSRKSKLNELLEYFRKIDLEVNVRHQRQKILMDLENSLEGFAYSVKTVISQAKRGAFPGVRGTVASLISLPQKYSVAVETALGGSLQHIVVEQESVAKKAIRFLKEQKAGRATFLPMTSIKESVFHYSGVEQCAGYVGLASELVEFHPDYRSIVSNLLGRTVVVEDIDDAVELAKQYQYRFRVVTLDGQVVNAGGSMTGGSQNKNTGLLGRKNEISELEHQMKELSEKKESYQSKKDELSAQVRQLEVQLQGTESEITVLLQDKIRFDGERKRLVQLREQSQQEIDRIQQSRSSYQKRIKEWSEGMADFQNQLSEMEKETHDLEQKLSNLQNSQDHLSNQRAELDQWLNQHRILRAEQGKELENKKQFLSQLEDRQSSHQSTRNQLEENIRNRKEEIERTVSQIAELEERSRTYQGDQKELDQRIAACVSDRNRWEQETSLLRREQQEHQASREKLGQELARLDERKASIEKEYESLIAKMWEEYKVTPSEVQNLVEAPKDSQQAQSQLNAVKAKIKSLGNINVDAIDEYKEVFSRYKFMKNQLEDVEHSRNELIRLIQDLTANMTSMFATAFEHINQNFKEIFVQLFGGGSANLSLSDPEHILECGIDIEVQPPGKLIKNLSALSGGEKAFAAIAIYFAILKVRPSPFCILDEIEAALDDVNVNKFASYLKTIDDNTQFIVITHRRGTMEQADVLYGVTMQEEGVSKLLELKVSEIEQKMKLEE